MGLPDPQMTNEWRVVVAALWLRLSSSESGPRSRGLLLRRKKVEAGKTEKRPHEEGTEVQGPEGDAASSSGEELGPEAEDQVASDLDEFIGKHEYLGVRKGGRGDEGLFVRMEGEEV